MKHFFLNTIFTLIFGLSLQSFATISPNKMPFSPENLGDGCAQIVLKTGDVISADVTQITENTILYKPCGNKSADAIRLEKSKILKIKAPDGSIIFTGSDSNINAPTVKSTNGMAIAGFVCSLVAGPLFGLIFSLIGLNQIKKSPEKYTGEGLATAGIVISAISFLLILLLSVRR